MPKIHAEQIGAPLFWTVGEFQKILQGLFLIGQTHTQAASVRRSITTKQNVTKSCPN